MKLEVRRRTCPALLALLLIAAALYTGCGDDGEEAPRVCRDAPTAREEAEAIAVDDGRVRVRYWASSSHQPCRIQFSEDSREITVLRISPSVAHADLFPWCAEAAIPARVDIEATLDAGIEIDRSDPDQARCVEVPATAAP